MLWYGVQLSVCYGTVCSAGMKQCSKPFIPTSLSSAFYYRHYYDDYIIIIQHSNRAGVTHPSIGWKLVCVFHWPSVVTHDHRTEAHRGIYQASQMMGTSQTPTANSRHSAAVSAFLISFITSLFGIYTVSQKSVRYLTLHNVKKPEPIFIILSSNILTIQASKSIYNLTSNLTFTYIT